MAAWVRTTDLRHWPAHVGLLRFAPCLHRPGPPIVRSAALRPGRLTLRLLRAGYKTPATKRPNPAGAGFRLNAQRNEKQTISINYGAMMTSAERARVDAAFLPLIWMRLLATPPATSASRRASARFCPTPLALS